QVGLSPIQEADLPQQAQTLEISGQPAQLYDVAGQNPSSGEKVRILAAISRREGTAWFFKMNGDDQLVAEQKPNVIAPLNSCAFPTATAAGAPGCPPSHPPIGGGAQPGGAQAAVNVSMSSGTGGGLLANLNRWRGQLGLSPFAESDLAKETKSIAASD